MTARRTMASFGLHVAGPSDQGDPWQTRGACRDVNPELFFTNGRGRPSQDQQERAAAVCRECPVQRECREAAIEAGEEYGVWGGMTETQLHAAIRNRTKKPENRGAELQPCGTWAAYLRHRRAGEQACAPCMEAARAKKQQQRAKTNGKGGTS